MQTSSMKRIKQINNLVIYQREDGHFLVVNSKDKDKKKNVVCFCVTLDEAIMFCKSHKEHVILRGHNVKPGDIVVLCSSNQVGKIVLDYDDRSKWRFWPEHEMRRSGTYNSARLQEITAKDVRPVSEEEKLKFYKRDFSWGKVLNVYNIADYMIFEYLERQSEEGVKPKKLYHPFVNWYDLHTSYYSLDEALLGCIAYRRTHDTSVVDYIMKLISK